MRQPRQDRQRSTCVHRFGRRRPALLQHVLHHHDAAARPVALVAEQHIGRAGRGADAAMHAGAQRSFPPRPDADRRAARRENAVRIQTPSHMRPGLNRPSGSNAAFTPLRQRRALRWLNGERRSPRARAASRAWPPASAADRVHGRYRASSDPEQSAGPIGAPAARPRSARQRRLPLQPVREAPDVERRVRQTARRCRVAEQRVAAVDGEGIMLPQKIAQRSSLLRQRLAAPSRRMQPRCLRLPYRQGPSLPAGSTRRGAAAREPFRPQPRRRRQAALSRRLGKHAQGHFRQRRPACRTRRTTVWADRSR